MSPLITLDGLFRPMGTRIVAGLDVRHGWLYPQLWRLGS